MQVTMQTVDAMKYAASSLKEQVCKNTKLEKYLFGLVLVVTKKHVTERTFIFVLFLMFFLVSIMFCWIHGPVIGLVHLMFLCCLIAHKFSRLRYDSAGVQGTCYNIYDVLLCLQQESPV